MGVAYPASLPVSRIHHPGLEMRHGRFHGILVLIPGCDLPEISRERLKGFPSVPHQYIVRLDDTGIPVLSFSRSHCRRIRPDHDIIAGLLAYPVREPPRQPRLGRVYAQRGIKVFAAHAGYPPCRSRVLLRRRECGGSKHGKHQNCPYFHILSRFNVIHMSPLPASRVPAGLKTAEGNPERKGLCWSM